MITKEELAARLDGIQYPAYRTITSDLIQAAKGAGLVIVYGASDDLMEFDGAIRDELGCYNGRVAYVDKAGLLDRDQIDDDDDDAIASYVSRKETARTIEALWCEREDCSWTYRTDIPHATFKINEGDELYCIGLVFSVADLVKP